MFLIHYGRGKKSCPIEGDTKLQILANDFPDADRPLRAVAEFRNSNNEIQEKNVEIDFTAESRVILVRQEVRFIIAEFVEKRKTSRLGMHGFLIMMKTKKGRYGFPGDKKLTRS